MFLRTGSARQLMAAAGVVSLLAGLSGTSNTLAQTTSGTIVGYVRDKVGKPIPEALVNIINEENGKNRAALTDEKGYYVRVNLPPGTYKLVASKPGFVDQVVVHFPVQFNQKKHARRARSGRGLRRRNGRTVLGQRHARALEQLFNRRLG